MAINGSDFINRPWNTTFSPYTDKFEQIFGNGNVFWLFPIIALTIAVWYKTRDPTVAGMFLMSTSGILSFSTFLAGIPELGMLFTVLVGLAIAIVAADFILKKRGG